MNLRQRQQGVVLAVCLMLLVAMTLLGLATVRSSSVNLLIVGNLQSAREAEALAQEAIERTVDKATHFLYPPAPTEPLKITVSNGQVVDVYIECVHNRMAKGYSATSEMVPNDTAWRIRAEYVSPDGAEIDVHQGVKMRMPVFAC